MNNHREELYNLALSLLTSKIELSEEDINKNIEMLAVLPLFNGNLLIEDIEFVRKKIQANLMIKLDLGSIIVAKDHKKWFINRKSTLSLDYWARYKNFMLKEMGFSIEVVKSIDSITDKLTDLLGDPTIEFQFQRRGLIIGDVQSGKTANYVSLINKAADVGYKVIILLTGTIEKLRKQTQRRLDEGFVGVDSNAMLKSKTDIKLGVGVNSSLTPPIVFTSKSSDFNMNSIKSLGLSLDSLNQPILFVIKKNVSVLKNLNRWLKSYNLHGKTSIPKPLLLIDDEADNASINTNNEDKDPTQTNAQIVQLLSLFDKSSYIGYTATPFANIFIDPSTNEEMQKANLFPKDYIYSLRSPSHYFGARNIFDDDSTYNFVLQNIDDGEDYIPLKHKKEYIISELPNSLKIAIICFFITNVIRDKRKHTITHRSMIVNISRFVLIQSQVYELIYEYVEDLKNIIKIFSKLSEEEALINEDIKYIRDIYYNLYSNVEYRFDEILECLDVSTSPIQVFKVNQSENRLDYEENSLYGIRAIIVGGFALSRGLTLEGLVISYVYRNSKMYDTLMQMGRWFGYRDGYDDIVRIWLSRESINWYGEISESTDELKDDIDKMEASGATPLEFGLRVRNNEKALIVTARNKMRSALKESRLVSLSADVIEAPKINNDVRANKHNLEVVHSMVSAIISVGGKCVDNVGGPSNDKGFKKIKKEIILEVIKTLDISIANIKFDASRLCDFILNYMGNELDNWDIVFLNGSSEKKFYIDERSFIKCNVRKFGLLNENKLIQILGTKNRLGSISSSFFGLTKKDVDFLNKKLRKTDKALDQKSYFSEYVKRNPLFMIYCLDLESSKTAQEFKMNLDDFGGDPILGFSIGIPYLTHRDTSYITYQLNVIAQQNSFATDEEYNGDDEDE